MKALKVNPPKTWIALAALVCITILLITDSIEANSGVGLLSFIVGYGIGNGITARGGNTSAPIIGPADPAEEETA